MAVVRILKSSSNFSAVEYNNSRVAEGEGELLKASNFGPAQTLFGTMDSYRSYLKNWSNRNSRIKNNQFHVTISVKGDSLSKEQLGKLGEEWLKEMGYGDNPYLIYFHSNSKNNHIHLISSRVDRNGKKISDSFEKEKALRLLNKLLAEDESVKMRNKINELLRYSFSTVYQFEELLKKDGFNVNDDKNSDFIRIKTGTSSMNLNKKLIEFCAARYHREMDAKRKKQMQAYIFKYGKMLNRDDFAYFMKINFGIDFIFYGKDDKIYGFTVIDYNNKSIHKGSEVLSLKSMNALFDNMVAPKKNPVEILKQFVYSYKKPDFDEINVYLKRFGFHIEGSYLMDRLNNMYLIPQEIVDQIQNNNKVVYIRDRFVVHNKAERFVLAKLFNIDEKKISFSKGLESSDDKIYYKEILQRELESIREGSSYRPNFNVQIFKVEDRFVLFDYDENKLVSFNQEELGFFESELGSVISRDYMDGSLEQSGPGFSLADLNFDRSVGSSSGKRKKR